PETEHETRTSQDPQASWARAPERRVDDAVDPAEQCHRENELERVRTHDTELAAVVGRHSDRVVARRDAEEQHREPPTHAADEGAGDRAAPGTQKHPPGE